MSIIKDYSRVPHNFHLQAFLTRNDKVVVFLSYLLFIVVDCAVAANAGTGGSFGDVFQRACEVVVVLVISDLVEALECVLAAGTWDSGVYDGCERDECESTDKLHGRLYDSSSEAKYDSMGKRNISSKFSRSCGILYLLNHRSR